MTRRSALRLALDGPYLVLAAELPLLYIHTALLGPVRILLPHHICALGLVNRSALLLDITWRHLLILLP